MRESFARDPIVVGIESMWISRLVGIEKRLGVLLELEVGTVEIDLCLCATSSEESRHQQHRND
jgi:hypothetical protein